MFIRWTIPRFRFDQLMGLAWKVMLPLALLNLVAVLVVKHFELSPWWLLPASVVSLLAVAWVSLLMPRPPRVVSPRLRGLVVPPTAATHERMTLG
jgi:NADH-quinone oxidoreductase subunit H